MALKRDVRYPGRWTAASSGHPQGAFKNRTAPGSLDGSYIEQDWANDWDGFFSSLLNGAGISANGSVDAVGASQYFSAFQSLTTGRLISVRVFAAAGTYTYTPSAGTVRVVVECLGAGGAGAGAPATTAGNGSLGSAGGAGAYAQSFITSGFSGVSIVVGAGGTSVSGGFGNPGGASSFGSILSCPGGKGGGTAGPSSGSFLAVSGNSNPPSGGNIKNNVGQAADISICFSSTSSQAGRGGATLFGPGAQPTGANVAGVAATSPGSGGGGTAQSASGAALTGGAGAPGIVVVWEYA